MSVTAEALTSDGWLRTGDVGTLDADGNLCITDRIKELIKVRAFQVAPAELEAILCSSDDVADAGVVGVYDKTEATEWPRAYVVAADQEKSEADLKTLAHDLKSLVESHAARYKWLVGGIVFVKAIPKSPSGKILRRVIRDGGVQGFEVMLYQRKKRDAKL
jgi:acyl-coenzyme A synthetase/AMP-(fatty) acid ligase